MKEERKNEEGRDWRKRAQKGVGGKAGEREQGRALRVPRSITEKGHCKGLARPSLDKEALGRAKGDHTAS